MVGGLFLYRFLINTVRRKSAAIRAATIIVNFGSLAFSCIDNYGEGCGLTPRRGIGHGTEALVVLGCPNKGNLAFGGSWNKSSSVIVRNVTGSCAAQDGCPLCKFQPVYAYPDGFPGRVDSPACNVSGSSKSSKISSHSHKPCIE